MNFISYDNAYSLYPKETFETRRSLVFDPGGPGRDSARQKYIDRGWTMITEPSAFDQTDVRSPLRGGSRWVGDGRSWKLTLSRENVNLSQCIPPRVDFPVCDCLALHSWQMRYIPFPFIAFAILQSPVLRSKYTVGNILMTDYMLPWIRKASEMLKREERGCSPDCTL